MLNRYLFELTRAGGFFVFSKASRWRGGALLAVLACGLAAAGCASDSDAGMKTSVRDNGSCMDTRRELDRLDAKGVPSWIEASNAGKKLSGSQKADVDRYNRLLQNYLGSRCHL